MNHLQRSIAAVSTGPPGFEEYTLNGAANDTDLQWFCSNFIMRSPEYTSFSVLALSLVIGFGGLVICCSFWLESTVAWIQNYLKLGVYRQIYWKLDSVFHLQRMAFEEAGLGDWDKCASDIPITARGQKIQLPTKWDEWHPSIRGKQAVSSQSVHPQEEGEKKDQTEVTSTEVSRTLSGASTNISSPTESQPRNHEWREQDQNRTDVSRTLSNISTNFSSPQLHDSQT
jgi:hypothetical protein